ncbi:hypothetical protein [Peptacetobacter hiranonis]|uniref:hypothetical protein n=1 Tax=Peptacetobacter hiranonis TaxID=89152 RepID=UPI0022DF31C7|nr:hypothetical protein [Peptacetobacter hiranonis]
MLSTTLSIIATIIFIGLMAIYPLSKIKLSNSKKERIKNRIYCQLKKNHSILAIIFLILSLIHGIVAIKNGATEGMISGKIAWMFILMMSILIVFRKINKEKWAILHRLLAVISAVLVIIHIGGVLI